jgi:pimeloyl-ACP methyl ester carboxylesterase
VTWKPEFLEFVRIHYGWLLSAEWPRLQWVRAMGDTSRDPVVYDWPHIQARALVIGGEVDGPRFPELARNAAERLPNGELVLFPNVGHNPHLEAPERFHPALVRFLTGDAGETTEGRSAP